MGPELVVAVSAIRSFALARAAVTLRIYLPVSMAGGAPFDVAYPIIAWGVPGAEPARGGTVLRAATAGVSAEPAVD